MCIMSSASSNHREAEVERLREQVQQLEFEVARGREAEQELRLFQARRESHLANTPLAVIHWDTEFRVAEWNPGAQRIFGYSAEEAVGKHGCELIVSGEVRPLVEQVFRDLLKQTGGRRSTNENVTKAGTRILCEWYNTPVLDNDGNVVGAASIAQDVTEQVENAEALDRSEGMLRSILEYAPDVIMLVDSNARITYINHVASNYGRQDVLGQSVYEFVMPEQRSTVQFAVERVFVTGQPEEFEVQDLRNGRWYHTKIAPVLEEGRTNSVVMICLDVHQRVEQERELRDSKKTFETLAKNIPGVVYLCKNDDRYTVIYLSDEVEKLLGIPAGEFLADNISFVELYHPDDASVIPGAVSSAVDRRDRFHLTYRLKHANGSWVWVEEHGQGVFDDDGQLKFLEGTLFDVTAKREAEEELRKHRDELEDLVNLRTNELRTANHLLRSDYKRQVDLTRAALESEEKFRSLSDASPGPVLVTRPDDGRIIYVNQRLMQLLDVPGDQILGKRLSDFLVQPADSGELRRMLEEQGQVDDHELRLKRSNDSMIWTSASQRSVSIREEPIVLTILLDITERKLYAEQLRSKTRMLRRMLDIHDRDRQLVAYEIHDGIVQDMTGITMHLQGAAAKLTSDPPAARRDLDYAAGVLGEAIDEARRLIDGLRPGALEEDGMLRAVEQLCRQIEERHGIQTHCGIEVSFQRLAPAIEMAIYRIVQEGLNNIVKHSQSKTAFVSISQRNDVLVIRIEDEGVGFDPPRIKSRHYGLSGIRDRAKLLGGKARIKSQPGHGTRLRIKLPLDDVLMPDAWPDPTLDSDDDSSSDWRMA